VWEERLAQVSSKLPRTKITATFMDIPPETGGVHAGPVMGWVHITSPVPDTPIGLAVALHELAHVEARDCYFENEWELDVRRLARAEWNDTRVGRHPQWEKEILASQRAIEWMSESGVLTEKAVQFLRACLRAYGASVEEAGYFLKSPTYPKPPTLADLVKPVEFAGPSLDFGTGTW
jgi:hypothetical protein